MTISAAINRTGAAGIAVLLAAPFQAEAFQGRPPSTPILSVSIVEPVAERRQTPGTYRKTAPRPGIVNGVRGSLTRRAGYIAFNGYWYPPSAFGSPSNSGRTTQPGRPVPQY